MVNGEWHLRRRQLFLVTDVLPVTGAGSWLAFSKFQVSDSRFQVPGYRLQVTDYRLQILSSSLNPGFAIMVTPLWFIVSSAGQFQVSGSGFR